MAQVRVNKKCSSFLNNKVCKDKKQNFNNKNTYNLIYLIQIYKNEYNKVNMKINTKCMKSIISTTK